MYTSSLMKINGSVKLEEDSISVQRKDEFATFALATSW